MGNTNRRIETIIVPRLGTAVPASGDDLYNSSTDVINLAVGGFGLYRDNAVATSSILEGTAAAMTVTNTKRFKVLQHRDTTNPRTPLLEKTFIDSGWITPQCNLSVRGTAATVAAHDVWRIGESTGTGAGEVPILDETEYIVYSTIDGRRTDMLFGLSENLTMGRFTTPNYFTSTVYTTTAQQRDHILQNVAYDFNNNSQKSVVALCIDYNATTATGDRITLTAAAALAVGSVVIVGYQDDGSANKLLITLEIKQTLTNLIASGIAGTAQIIAYARNSAANLAVAGRIIAGGRTAGTPDATTDMIVFITMDIMQATYDEIQQRKERARIGLDGGFVSTTSQRQSFYSEGAGYADDMLQWYRDTMSMRFYPGGRPWQGYFLEYSSEIVPGAIYDVYVIQHCEADNNTMLNVPTKYPKMTIVAIQNTTTVGFTGYTGVANTQKTYFEARINSWFPTTTYPYTTINL